MQHFKNTQSKRRYSNCHLPLFFLLFTVGVHSSSLPSLASECNCSVIACLVANLERYACPFMKSGFKAGRPVKNRKGRVHINIKSILEKNNTDTDPNFGILLHGNREPAAYGLT